MAYIQQFPVAIELQVCFMALCNSCFISSTVQFIPNLIIVDFRSAAPSPQGYQRASTQRGTLRTVHKAEVIIYD